MNLVKNVGQTDRNIRYAVAGVLVLLGVISASWLLSVLGLIVLATAYLGTCGAYIPLGISTKKNDEQ
ncbi:YgaP family membrane protein [Halochromatium salexigens]|uniref:Inner membrane protein YgaP-like transmembrane domain-containing protein n=1 Tax=Halochromatium salexigens TaxID=49447 RepID=A0AAJ0XHI9_HALSE|nr:DUF2892 domain-containing protein [Halochromatium salexigens]MBK5931682.1 hypothetical protein [Halochromatium salexigens]